MFYGRLGMGEKLNKMKNSLTVMLTITLILTLPACKWPANAENPESEEISEKVSEEKTQEESEKDSERNLVPADCEDIENIGLWQPVWCEEFNYEGLPDDNKWSYDVGGEGWGNNELQYYTSKDRDNAYVANGYLTIEAKQENIGSNKYSSARLVSKNKGDWTYGKFQIRARVPGGRGTWAAAWMLPTENNYGDAYWPDNGEIDIMEYVGYDRNKLHSTIHTEAYNHMKGTQVGQSKVVDNMEEEFHLFEMEWEPNIIRYFIDGDEFYRIAYDPEKSKNIEPWQAWPFDQKFFIILNLAVGGNWGGAAGVDPNLDHMKYEIDYVRVYQKDYAGMDEAAPRAVTNLRILSENQRKIFLAWDIASDDVMVEYYEVYADDELLKNSAHNGIFIEAPAMQDQIVKVIPVDFAGNKGEAKTITISAPEIPRENDRIEAEDYVAMSGVQTESTSDSGGGENVGWIDAGDYMTYLIDVTESGNYTVSGRIASESLGGSFELYQDSKLLTTLTFSATGNWQNWETKTSSSFSLTSGQYTFKVLARKSGWNINYFEFNRIN